VDRGLDSHRRAGGPIGAHRLAALHKTSYGAVVAAVDPQPVVSGPRFPPVRVAHATH